MDIPAWISTVCAVLTLIGAAVSWLRSNVSKQARAAAESARDEAQRTVEAAEQTAAGVQRLADTLAEANSAPPWEVKWEKGDTYALVNTGNTTLTTRFSRRHRQARSTPSRRPCSCTRHTWAAI